DQDPIPPVPSLPSDLSRWQEHDFFIARLIEKPDLMEVIARVGADRRDDEEIARILTRLLQPEVYAGLEALVSRNRKEEEANGKEYSVKLIEAVVDALAQNTTASACRTLAQLVVGKLATEDNGAASTAALKSLAAHPSDAHEDMLLRVAVEAGQLVGTVEPAPSSEALRRQAFALLAACGSSKVRVRAAEYLTRNNPPTEIRSGLEQLLMDLRPENLEAHVVLYMGAGDPKPSREVLAGHFAALSSMALEHQLGVRVQSDAREIERTRRAASVLWSQNFTLVVEGRLNRLDAWSDEPSLLSLALSLPTDSMRAAVAQELEVQWGRGPGPSGNESLGGSTVVEPGSLVLLRKFLAERGESSKSPSLVGLHSPRAVGGRGGPAAARQQQEWLLQGAWTRSAGNLAADWCARCRKAAHDRDAAERALGRRIDWSEGLGKMPIQPHTSEGVTATHTVLWGSGAPAGVDGQAVDPLALHYVRIEEQTRPTRLLAYYGRVLSKHRRREIENGACFEGLHEEAPAGVLRSLDVRITRAGADLRRLPDEEQDLIVEILAVTIRDPAGSLLNGPS
ncbi:MAG: hypothetical protein ACYC6Y_26660, partial [Thermoguttaceae bacterium]